jgi:hypothetical protein
MRQGPAAAPKGIAMASKLGRISVWLSTLCVVHCILEPIVLPLLPLAGIVLPIDHRVENGLIATSVFLALWNITIGFPKYRSFGPASLLGLAALLFAAGRGGLPISPPPEKLGFLATTLAAALLAVSQFWNRNKVKNARACIHECCREGVSDRG